MSTRIGKVSIKGFLYLIFFRMLCKENKLVISALLFNKKSILPEKPYRNLAEELRKWEKSAVDEWNNGVRSWLILLKKEVEQSISETWTEFQPWIYFSCLCFVNFKVCVKAWKRKTRSGHERCSWKATTKSLSASKKNRKS